VWLPSTNSLVLALVQQQYVLCSRRLWAWQQAPLAYARLELRLWLVILQCLQSGASNVVPASSASVMPCPRPWGCLTAAHSGTL
jgi:hypothetical protein